MTGRCERLDAGAVRGTVDRLHARITARFPERNLRHVAGELAGLVRDVGEQEARARRHEHVARTTSLVAVVPVVSATVFALAMAMPDAVASATSLRAFEWLPVLESAIDDTVFAAIAVWFLLAVPGRMQRAATLRRLRRLHRLHRLRSPAHVIDMHQPTEDRSGCGQRSARPRSRSTWTSTPTTWPRTSTTAPSC